MKYIVYYHCSTKYMYANISCWVSRL